MVILENGPLTPSEIKAMDTKPRAMPPDGGLKEPKQVWEDTFSAGTVVMETWFPDAVRRANSKTSVTSMDELTTITKDDLGNAESRGYVRGYTTGLVTGICGLALVFVLCLVIFQ